MGTLPHNFNIAASSGGGGGKADDCRQRYISSDLGFSYHFIPGASVPDSHVSVGGCSVAELQRLLKNEQSFRMKSLQDTVSDLESKLHQFRETMNVHTNNIMNAMVALNEASSGAYTESGGSRKPKSKAMDAASTHTDYAELKPSLRHVLVLHRQMLHNMISFLSADGALCNKNLAKAATESKADIMESVRNMFLVQYMPAVLSKRFYAAMYGAGFPAESCFTPSKSANIVEISDDGKLLTINNVSAKRSYVTSNPEKVPDPLFYHNAYHTRQLEKLLKSFGGANGLKNSGLRGIDAHLLIGNQGVGKNKIIDKFLNLLNLEREYIQLHRDTSIQSLTQIPSLKDGKIVYEDSPLIVAARSGRVLIVDEADKAPLEVVCLMKNLIEDGELLLYDGRRLITKSHSDRASSRDGFIPIHPDFKIVLLANRPGFPFLGNNFFKECGDVFQNILVIENLDKSSELKLLQSYAPNVNRETLLGIANTFEQLRAAHEARGEVSKGSRSGEINYPFSAREAVAIVKHLEAFPEDSIGDAVENVLAFEGCNSSLRKTIALIFQRNGLLVPVERVTFQDSEASSGDSALNRLFSRSLLRDQKYVSLTPIVDIPPPVDIGNYWECLSNNKIPLHTEAISTKKAALWGTVDRDVLPCSISPCRLFQFNEEFGRIQLTVSKAGSEYDPYERMFSNSTHENTSDLLNETTENVTVATMIGGGPGNLIHAITQNPLTLHSVVNLKVDNSDAPPAIVRHQLLTPDLSWKMMDRISNPVLLPLHSELGDSVAVLLPDMGMMLYVPPGAIAEQNSNTDDDCIRMIALPFMQTMVEKKIVGSGSGRQGHKSSSFMSKMLRNHGTNSGDRDVMMSEMCVSASGGHLVAMWSRKVNAEDMDTRTTDVSRGIDIHFMDPVALGTGSAEAVTKIHISNNDLRGLIPEFIKSSADLTSVRYLKDGEWLLSLSTADKEGSSITIPAVLSMGATPILAVASGENLHTIANKSLVLINGRQAPSSVFPELGTTGPGNSSLHAYQVAGEGLRVWPREESETGNTGFVSGYLKNWNSGTAFNGWMPHGAKGTVCFSNAKDDVAISVFSEALPGNRKCRQNCITELEVNDTKTCTSKRINLSSIEKYQNVLGDIPKYITDKNTIKKEFTVLSSMSESQVVGTALLGDGAGENSNMTAVVCYSNGVMRMFDTDELYLQKKLSDWRSLLGHNATKSESGSGGSVAAPSDQVQELLEKLKMHENLKSKPKTESSMPKHGKDDDKQHVGGNTWAGGSGGSDTAGMGECFMCLFYLYLNYPK